jgi:manganese/zinc/iron transport system permease protein
MLELFVDPLLRGPFVGSLMIGIACALVGVCLAARKQLLIGETLAHASWPGACLAGLFLGALNVGVEHGFFWVLLVAGVFAFLALRSVRYLSKRVGLQKDSALCLVLASYFALGLLIVSGMQLFYPIWHRQIQSLLFGELASISQAGVVFCSSLSIAAIFTLYLLYKEIQAVSFDPGFAKVSNMRTKVVDQALVVLIILAAIIGMKSVGVVLMSGLLIAPALAAQPFTYRLSRRLLLAPVIATIGSVLGHFGAYRLSQIVNTPIPTGPLVVLVLTLLALAAHLIAPEQGLISRWIRRKAFVRKSREENILKRLWYSEGSVPVEDFCISGVSIQKAQRSILALVKRGLIDTQLFKTGQLKLTQDGHTQAQRLVRLHRLWEVYLSTYFEVSHARAHYNAEQIEHILTPELEKELEAVVSSYSNSLHKTDIPEKISSSMSQREVRL